MIQSPINQATVPGVRSVTISPPTAAAIRTEDLRKTYTTSRGDVPAVRGISLYVAAGEFFGLLGPNGAGKSTTIGMLTTLIVPTGGHAWVSGRDVVADPVGVKRTIGVVPQAAHAGDHCDHVPAGHGVLLAAHDRGPGASPGPARGARFPEDRGWRGPGVRGALIVIPIVLYVHAAGQAPHAQVTNWPLLALILVAASMLTAALGLLLGTLMDPRKMQMLFAVILLPATMLGCVYYPWSALHHIRWLQIAVLFNPMVYMSEGLRAVLTPGVGHLAMWAILLVLIGGAALIGYLGTRTFTRRVLN